MSALVLLGRGEEQGVDGAHVEGTGITKSKLALATSSRSPHPSTTRCLTNMGTEEEDFITLTERIGRKTGGVSVSPFVTSVKGSPLPKGYLMVRGKATADKAGDLLQVFHDILLTARLDDAARFKQVSALFVGGGMCSPFFFGGGGREGGNEDVGRAWKEKELAIVMPCLFREAVVLVPRSGSPAAHAPTLQMVLETRSGMEAGIVGSGHSFAGSRLDAQRR